MKLQPLQKDRFYHIYNRGINSSTIFSSDRNKEYFLGQYKKHLGDSVSTFAYCLLQNHFHLVVRLEKDPKLVTQSFSNFFNSYVKSYNKEENRTGSLFEKHFKRIEVDTEAYLKHLIIYVHLNPMNHFGEDFRKYKFSSYSDVMANEPSLLNVEEIYHLFGDKENFQTVHTQKNIVLPEKLILD